MFEIGVRKVQAAFEAKKPNTSFLRDRYFPNVIESNHRDVLVETRRGNVIALPTVRRGDSPLSLAAVAPHEVRRYEPPFHFYEATVTADELDKRVFGEPIEEPYPPHERAMTLMAEKLHQGAADSLMMIQEAYASQVIKTGTITPKRMLDNGDLVDAPTISFPVDSNLVGKTLSAKWAAATTGIMGKIAEPFLAVWKAGGKMPTDMVVGSDVLDVLFSNTEFMNYYNNRRIEAGRIESTPLQDGATHVATLNVPKVGNINIYTYITGYSYSKNDTDTKFIGDKSILVACPGFGTMAYGAVYDKVGASPTLHAGQMITHAVEGDASNLFAYKGYVQSAPLPIPTTLDQYAYWTVVA